MALNFTEMVPGVKVCLRQIMGSDMQVSEHSTVMALEELLGLLRGNNPDPSQALEQVESILQQEPCVKELQAAATGAVEIIKQLLLPVLRQDKIRLGKAIELQESWQGDTFARNQQRQEKQARQQELLQEMSGWIIDCSVAEQDSVVPARRAGGGIQVQDAAIASLPRSLFARLVAVLRLMCESEVELVAQVEEWQDQAEVPWLDVATTLQQLQAAGHRAAVLPWMRQRRAFYDALLKVADACEKSLGRKDDDASQLLQKMHQPGSRVEAHRAHGLLYSRLMALHQEARSLNRQQDDSLEVAKQLKDRLNQLEADLARARREQFLDPITGIPDRFAFTAHLQRYLERAVHLGEVFSLLLLHFYDLQQLLDSLDDTTDTTAKGGLAERLLMALVDDMRRNMPIGALLTRLSVERFVILLPKHTGSDGDKVGLVLSEFLEDTRFSLDGKEVVVEVYANCAAYQLGMDAKQMLEVTNRLAASAHAERGGSRKEARQVRAC